MRNLFLFGKLAAVTLVFHIVGDTFAKGQDNDFLLISDLDVQIEATAGLNSMYNFDFEEAERQFRIFRYKYPNHPLPYFLMGLNEWWKIMPNLAVEKFDEGFEKYMLQSIERADNLYDVDSTQIEGAFFLSASHGFLARLYSERSRWFKAVSSANKALNYLDDCRGKNYLSPELMFGDGIYNYFTVWIPENYPQLKPVMMMFSKGDKELGLSQLDEVAHNAFYTRTEAQYWLMRILFSEEGQKEKALFTSDYLRKTYPNNPYFHRYYARMLFSTGRMTQAKTESELILQHIDSGKVGYEATSGRYAGYFLGYIYEYSRNQNKALEYYKKAVSFGEEIEAYESGYFLYSMMGIARIYSKQGKKREAKRYLKSIKKYAKRKHPAHKQAREYLKQLS